MKNIYINVSDISSLIGQSTWDQVTPFERLWKKCEGAKYDELTIKAPEASSTTASAQKEILNEHIENNNLNEFIKDKQYSIKEKYKKVNQMINELSITTDEKIRLQQQTQTIVNTTHGVMNEQAVIDKCQEKFAKTKIDTSQKFFSKRFDINYKSSNYQWFICGRMDGIYDDPEDESNSHIIEVKNRVKGFFNSVRNYEKTQVQMYMWILDEKYKFVALKEQYKNDTRTTKVYYDTDYLKEILDLLRAFIFNFETVFLDDDEMKEEYVSMSNYDKTEYIQSLVL